VNLLSPAREWRFEAGVEAHAHTTKGRLQVKFSAKWLAGLAALAGLLVAAPMVIAQGEPQACGAAGAPPLEVVGLTEQETLICFPAGNPSNEREIGQLT